MGISVSVLFSLIFEPVHQTLSYSVKHGLTTMLARVDDHHATGTTKPFIVFLAACKETKKDDGARKQVPE